MDVANYSSRGGNPNPSNIMVGISRDSDQLKDRLTSPQQTKREIIPIVGMGGIGKTTLARHVYDDSLVVSHFDRRAWVTVSQDYDIRQVFLGLVGCINGQLGVEMLLKKEEDELGLVLYQNLKDRRYFIVLDDMWDENAWDEMKRFFPDDNNGSRVMVTTRESNVANYTAGGSNRYHHQMSLLSKNESWNLLHRKVFAGEGISFPPELAKIGEKIANNCGGLPLAIHVMGGILSQVERTPESWNLVANNVSSGEKDDQVSKILSLSYNHLPKHLKPCFLYFAAYPEDFDIQRSRLIMLFLAEELVEPVSGKTLEEAADGSVKNYGIHDVLRDLCVRKASEENFFYVINKKQMQVHTSSSSLHRVSVHQSYIIRDIDQLDVLTRLTNSFLIIGTASRHILSDVIFGMLFLRVLDILEIEFYLFPKELLQLTNLRYLAFWCRSPFPSSISTLCNLQTLIFRYIFKYSYFGDPHHIHDFSSLRCIKFLETFACFAGRSLVVGENLQSLSSIEISHSFTSILKSAPNLKKLGILVRFKANDNIDLTFLCKLETLKCSSDLLPWTRSMLSRIIFTPSIKKLTMHECELPHGYMSKIGRELPNLEVLKLRNCTLAEPTWEPAEGEFTTLQFLVLEQLNLVKWIADHTNFPRLKCIVIRYCWELQEIPSGIGDIDTLETIEVYRSSASALDSARKIHEEQLDYGHEIQIKTTSSQ